MSVYDLTGRKALVTGGARGLGAGMAEALARAGAAVVIGDIREELGEATVDAIKKTGGDAAFLPLNVTDDHSWERCVEGTIAELGGLDILVNNAGVEITQLVVDLDPDDIRKMLDVNILGTALGIKHAFRAMRPGGPAGRGGAVVNIQLRPGQAVTGDEIRAFVKDRLGSVKAPKQVEVWPDLPRSKVGKVLKVEVKAQFL